MRLFTAVLLVAACDRAHREAPAPPPPATAPVASEPARAGCTLAPNPKLGAAKRIVAIGDIHGDLAAARAALRAGNAIDAADHWSGGDLVVVQLGDVLDRGDDETRILELFDRLEREAHAAGGAFVPLLGNHELMNAAHDFRYVTPGGMRDFDGQRAAELGPGGTWAKRLAHHDVIAIVGDTVFSHAGELGDWALHVDDTNLSARCWLDGQAPDPPAALSADDGPVWTRALGTPGAADCAAVDRALAALGVRRMVVAHTVQEHGIDSDCDGKLWRIDVGLAKLYGGPIEVLAIGDGEPRVVRGVRE
ncbi:MAG TPA: metallophosphoesterase [Kofleriaceae bacterium]|nr:metallophosphoesterase [Kofleriaceae bacterium]